MVRCPKCGTAHPRGDRPLARCPGCNEQLGACRYCSYYDAQMMDCTHPARPEELRIVDAGESLNCPDFTSILTTSAVRSHLWRLLRTAAIAVVLSLVVLLGAVRVYESVTRPPPPVYLRAKVSAPAETFRESGFDVKVLVLNEADCAAEDVQVFISGPTMPKLICQSVEPSDAFVEWTERTVCGWIGRLEPGEIGSVDFHFAAEEACEVELVAQVVAANLEGPEKIAIEGAILP